MVAPEHNESVVAQAQVLQRIEQVAAYLAQRAGQRTATAAENENRFDPRGVRTRLLARRA